MQYKTKCKHEQTFKIQIYIKLKSRTAVAVTNTSRRGIFETADVLNGSQRCTVQIFVNYVGCFQDTVYQDPSHYTITVQTFDYISTISLFYTTLAVYISD